MYGDQGFDMEKLSKDYFLSFLMISLIFMSCVYQKNDRINSFFIKQYISDI